MGSAEKTQIVTPVLAIEAKSRAQKPVRLYTRLWVVEIYEMFEHIWCFIVFYTIIRYN